MGAVVLSFAEEARGRKARLGYVGRNLGPGRALASLCGSSLRDDFFSWRGASGRIYVCSVFGREDFSVVEEFRGVSLVGVARRGGERRALCVLSSSELRLRGHAGVDEWHVHFGNDEKKLRDLSASLLG
ncbi:MAG TPA: hypothetical protein VEH76_08625 [Methylocystis sp.]|nr:hypothetical protein [Methylocystis sp.]